MFYLNYIHFYYIILLLILILLSLNQLQNIIIIAFSFREYTSEIIVVLQINGCYIICICIFKKITKLNYVLRIANDIIYYFYTKMMHSVQCPNGIFHRVQRDSQILFFFFQRLTALKTYILRYVNVIFLINKLKN